MINGLKIYRAKEVIFRANILDEDLSLKSMPLLPMPLGNECHLQIKPKSYSVVNLSFLILVFLTIVIIIISKEAFDAPTGPLFKYLRESESRRQLLFPLEILNLSMLIITTYFPLTLPISFYNINQDLP